MGCHVCFSITFSSYHFDFAKELIQEGAKIDVKDPVGKNPEDWCVERNCVDQWHTSISEAGKPSPKTRPLDKDSSNRVLYIIPYVMTVFSIFTMAYIPFYISIPIVLVKMYIVQRYLIMIYLGHKYCSY